MISQREACALAIKIHRGGAPDDSGCSDDQARFVRELHEG